MTQQHDDAAWKQAERQVAFKTNLIMYLIVNLFLIGVWYFTTGNRGIGYFWPIWPILGWGLGVVVQYVGVYHSGRFFSVEKEYESLRKKQS